MSQVISVRDIQEMIRNGQGVSIPDDAIVTPSARELLQDIETNGARAIATGAAAAATALYWDSTSNALGIGTSSPLRSDAGCCSWSASRSRSCSLPSAPSSQ